MATFFCPRCWAEVERDASACPRCGSDLDALDEAAYAEKLRRALWHPEGFTARRAAWLLGRRREKGAVPDLARRAREEPGVYLAMSIADALAAIDSPGALAALEDMRREEPRPVVTRHVEALLARARRA